MPLGTQPLAFIMAALIRELMRSIARSTAAHALAFDASADPEIVGPSPAEPDCDV
jgi:hypothetical protein